MIFPSSTSAWLNYGTKLVSLTPCLIPKYSKLLRFQEVEVGKKCLITPKCCPTCSLILPIRFSLPAHSHLVCSYCGRTLSRSAMAELFRLWVFFQSTCFTGHADPESLERSPVHYHTQIVLPQVCLGKLIMRQIVESDVTLMLETSFKK